MAGKRLDTHRCVCYCSVWCGVEYSSYVSIICDATFAAITLYAHACAQYEYILCINQRLFRSLVRVQKIDWRNVIRTVADLLARNTIYVCVCLYCCARWSRKNRGLPPNPPKVEIDYRTGYIRSHLRSPSGRVRWPTRTTKTTTVLLYRGITFARYRIVPGLGRTPAANVSLFGFVMTRTTTTTTIIIIIIVIISYRVCRSSAASSHRHHATPIANNIMSLLLLLLLYYARILCISIMYIENRHNKWHICENSFLKNTLLSTYTRIHPFYNI